MGGEIQLLINAIKQKDFNTKWSSCKNCLVGDKVSSVGILSMPAVSGAEFDEVAGRWSE